MAVPGPRPATPPDAPVSRAAPPRDVRAAGGPATASWSPPGRRPADVPGEDLDDDVEDLEDADDLEDDQEPDGRDVDDRDDDDWDDDDDPHDGPDSEDDDVDTPHRAGASDRARDAPRSGRRKRPFLVELLVLVLVAFVLTFTIQTFVARIYVIPSQSMEQTLIGCTGCTNDRVAVDKLTYHFSDPSPGDVVVFAGPPAWRENDEVDAEQPSSNVLVRGFQDALSVVGLGSTGEKDFVKRVIAVGGQTVACCDAQGRVTVDGRPLDESYLYIQPGTPNVQETFAPVQVPAGQLWVMGDNRNNSADSRYHGPIAVSDVIGQARLVVLPFSRWTTVPSIDPQATGTALGAAGPAGPALGGTAILFGVPAARWGSGRSSRRRWWTDRGPRG